jgi:divalent metal cation (Fe/Co/Zn/Cd) transporter
VAAIGAALIDGPAVRRLIHRRTLHLGPDELLVGAKVEFDPALSLAEAAEAIDEAERRVRAVVPSARIIYLEPDCYPGRSAGRTSLGPGPPALSQLGRSSSETALFLLDRSESVAAHPT